MYQFCTDMGNEIKSDLIVVQNGETVITTDIIIRTKNEHAEVLIESPPYSLKTGMTIVVTLLSGLHEQ